jgi:hypothetical protein
MDSSLKALTYFHNASKGKADYIFSSPQELYESLNIAAPTFIYYFAKAVDDAKISDSDLQKVMSDLANKTAGKLPRMSDGRFDSQPFFNSIISLNAPSLSTVTGSISDSLSSIAKFSLVGISGVTLLYGAIVLLGFYKLMVPKSSVKK